MSLDKSVLENKILAATLDDTTKVHLFKILDAGASQTELFLIQTILASKERYKIPEQNLDTVMKGEFNQP